MKKLLALFGLQTVLTISLELVSKEIDYLNRKDFVSDEEMQKRQLKIRLLTQLKSAILDVQLNAKF